MPRIGAAYTMAAVYNYNKATGEISYSNGGYIGRLARVNIQKADNNDNDWNGDNTVGETDNAFGGGTLELEVGEVSTEAAEDYFGLTVVDLSGDDAIDGVEDEDAKKIIYKAAAAVPYIGLGTVLTERIKGTGEENFTAVVLPKVQLSPPNIDVTTRGNTINWQNVTVPGKIFQDDQEEPQWKIESSPLSTMAQALAFIRHFLNIADPSATTTPTTPTSPAVGG